MTSRHSAERRSRRAPPGLVLCAAADSRRAPPGPPPPQSPPGTFADNWRPRPGYADAGKKRISRRRGSSEYSAVPLAKRRGEAYMPRRLGLSWPVRVRVIWVIAPTESIAVSVMVTEPSVVAVPLMTIELEVGDAGWIVSPAGIVPDTL